jgi:hypothetical protein
LFYCFSAKKGGDCIGLASHVMQVGNKDAAHFLVEQLTVPQEQKPEARTEKSQPRHARIPFDAEAFAKKLEYADEAAHALLIGTYRGRLYMGHRYESGVIAGFTYFADGELTHPKEWQPDSAKVIPLKRPA